MAFADTRIRSLETARDCAMLGARQRTIAWVTGLPPNFILRTVFDTLHPAPKGRPPYKEDFYFRAAVRVQSETSSFAVKYRGLVSTGFMPRESLVTAYRHYLSLIHTPSFCFDEAFYLVSLLDGIWAAKAPTIQLCLCARCGGQHVMALGSIASHGCPFCKLAQQDAGTCVRTLPLPRVPACDRDDFQLGCVCDDFPMHISALRFRRCLEALGAHHRVVSALLSSVPTPYLSPAPEPPSALVSVRRPLSLHRWGQAVKTPMRAQYGIAAIQFRRLCRAGFSPADALVGAYRHVRSLVQHDPLSFDRCFEVISLLEARWGVAEPELDLVPCCKCGAQHLVSRREHHAAHCPYCLLVRFPDQYRSRSDCDLSTPGA